MGVHNSTPSLGVSQTWQDVNASRALSTLYTNTTGKPIQLMITATNAQLQVNGQVMLQGSMLATGWIQWIVPVGATYYVSATAKTGWWELR